MIVRVSDVMNVRSDLSFAQRRVIIEAMAWQVDYPIHTMNAAHCGEFGCVRVIDALQDFKAQESLGETARSHAEHALRKIERAYIAHQQKESNSES